MRGAHVPESAGSWSRGWPASPLVGLCVARTVRRDADLKLTRRGLSVPEEYEAGVHKNLLDNAASASLTAGKELKVTRHGNIAWTTVPMHFTAKMKDGKSIDVAVRYTGIWEKRGKSWLLVHEHLSVPLGG